MHIRELFKIRGRHASACPECHTDLEAKATYCDICGYDLVTRTRDEASGKRRPI